MESSGNDQVKPTNTNNINNNIEPKISPKEIKQQIKLIVDLAVKKINSEVIINNDNNNTNPQSVEKIEVNIAEKNKESDTSSIINDKLKSNFLIKVYGILLFQFIIIFGFVLIFQIKSISSYIKTHPALYWSIYIITLIAYMVMLIAFLVNPENLNKVPINYFILFLMTIFLGLFCGVIASLYKYEIVICAITCVIAISFGSFCVGFFIKINNIKFWHLFVPSVVCLIIHYIIMILIFRKNYLYFFYCSLCALVYALAISADTIIIKEELTVDDYILGAISLTLDIIKLFIMILYYFGNSDCD